MGYPVLIGHAPPFLTAFVLIFVAELGDKTLYTILLLATRHRPIPVIVGSFAAFLVQGAIALALGSVLALLPQAIVQWLTVIVFAVFGIRLLITREEHVSSEPPSNRRLAFTAFAMVTAAEWGDASQIGTAALVAHLHSPVQVILGATAGLWLGTLLAVAAGRIIGLRMPAVILRRAAGILFCVFAVISALRGTTPA
jgi:putative Ca2+/H+ antiporter (TMEM165/GDT1 family)